MSTLELNQLDKHQVHEIWTPYNNLRHTPEGILYKLFQVSPCCFSNQRKDLMIGMKSQKYRLKDIFFTVEMVVEPAERQMGSLSNLAHGGAMISLLNEQVMGSLQDYTAGMFPAIYSRNGHNISTPKNERSFRFYTDFRSCQVF